MPKRSKAPTDVAAPKRRSLRLGKTELPTKAEAKTKPKKAPVKAKKTKEVEKATPEENPGSPAENGETKPEEEAPTKDAPEQKEEAAK